MVRRLRFLGRAMLNNNVLDAFIEQIVTHGHAYVFSYKPHVLGVLEWPYIHNQWSLQQRLNIILQHHILMEKQPSFLDIHHAKPLLGGTFNSHGTEVPHGKKIIDLHEHSPNTSIVLDRPSWFAREGEIVINLFKDDERIQSLAFTLASLNNQLVIYIGAIQGKHADDNSLLVFKTITKDLHGIRPVNFMITLLKLIADRIGVKAIYAVSDLNRHHHHPYFKGAMPKMLNSYNTAWEEHKGIKLDNGFYHLPVAEQRKIPTDIPSNKRAMYQRRYQMLDEIKNTISQLE